VKLNKGACKFDGMLKSDAHPDAGFGLDLEEIVGVLMIFIAHLGNFIRPEHWWDCHDMTDEENLTINQKI
jgi:hypothetical protein